MRAQREPVSPVRTLRYRPQAGPTVLARVLGAYLREAREAAGVTAGEAAEAIGGSRSKISRVETAQSPLQPRDVAVLLALYQVTPAEELPQILAMAERAARPEWFQPYAPVIRDWVQPLLGLESDAQTIRTYEPHFVPGLLQTEEYARTLAASSRYVRTAADIEDRVQLRKKRQERLLRPGGPRLWMMFDESVLHRPVGGPGVMRRQMEHLLEVMQGPTVIQVAQLHAVAQVTPGSAVTYLRFAASFLPDVVYMEMMDTGIYLENGKAVEEYRAVLDELSARAETPQASAEFIEHLLGR
jgi:transcriptional regulator with XRE-family HTH domain